MAVLAVYLLLAIMPGRIARGRLRYASAGHSTACVFDSEGEIRERLKSTATPLGLFPELALRPSQAVSLRPGELLAVLTDGVTEASPDGEEFFGNRRALETIRRHRHAPAEEIVEQLHAAVDHFLGMHAQNDDATALVLKVTGK